MRISVVVPFYNAERYLARCLDGLLSQSLPRRDYEIILVDNNSTDGSVGRARTYADVCLLHQPVQGSYAARNLGIGRAQGDVIATIDPDCRPAPHWLESIGACMQDPACGILLGPRRTENSSPALALLAAYEDEKIAYVVDRKVPEMYYGYTNNMAVRRTVFDRVGPFPERLRGGDTMFVQRAVDILGCDVVRFSPRMEVTHLEISTVGDYYRKRTIYGRSNERIGRAVAFRPLNHRERWEVFRRLVRVHDLSAMQALQLLTLLVPGAMLYEWGRRRSARRVRRARCARCAGRLGMATGATTSHASNVG